MCRQPIAERTWQRRLKYAVAASRFGADRRQRTATPFFFYIPTFKYQNRLLKHMAQDRISMPMSSAGLTRFTERPSSRIQITPGHVIVMVVVVIIFVLVLQLYGNQWFGL